MASATLALTNDHCWYVYPTTARARGASTGVDFACWARALALHNYCRVCFLCHVNSYNMVAETYIARLR